MKKSELIDMWAAATNIPKTVCEMMLNNLGRIAAAELKSKGEFAIHGVVSMKVQRREERNGRNPQTGEAVRIGARNVVKATAAHALKQAV